MEKVAILTVLLSSFVAVSSWAEASENVYKFACGNKTFRFIRVAMRCLSTRLKRMFWRFEVSLMARSSTSGFTPKWVDPIPSIKCLFSMGMPS
ncbi:hypothetical protein [Vibrio parahaemolyticus]|uniref:hypothetical protein n=1 Tax=Vibrio parahaemolyticus TaxID=670 RepID=UPI00227BC853|nr:hypothetical protein [Vibrio parahaemolyticus]WAG36372.1 hypothetical protein JK088_24495 [Vibrio parahaemolyticus]